MKPRPAKQIAAPKPIPPRAVVGTVHRPADLGAAGRLRRGEVDLLELRVDAFARNPEGLLRAARGWRLPLIVTVRSPEEGGAGDLAAPARAELHHRFLEVARLVDLELAALPGMRAILETAHRRGVGVILSHHDFAATPPVARLRTLARRAHRAGADLFKVATRLRTPADLARLWEFLQDPGAAIPVAAMGMGPDAPAARLLLGAAGSALNYGCLSRPNAPGQLPATLLKPLIDLLRIAAQTAR